MRRTVTAAAALLWASMAFAAPLAVKPAWMASTSFKPANPRAGEAMAYAAQSVRQDVRLQTATSRLRLRLTNELGAAVVNIGQVELRALGADGVLGPARLAAFGGGPAVTLAPGSVIYSDPIDFAAPAFSDVAVTVFYPDAAEPVAHRAMVRIAEGLQTPSSTTAPVRGAAVVSAIETEAPPVRCRKVVVALGDSITEGAGASAHNDWPAQLARRLAGARCDIVVVNAGISGNKVLSNGGSPSLISRIDRDVLSTPGLTDIVFVEGINDVRAAEADADPDAFAAALIEGYRQLVARAHAHGVRVIGGTLLPYKGTARQTDRGLAIVDQVNAAIRAGGIFDVVVDFNRATADPADPRRLRPDWHRGDWLHPNDGGYAAMAGAIPAALFDGSGR